MNSLRNKLVAAGIAAAVALSSSVGVSRADDAVASCEITFTKEEIPAIAIYQVNPQDGTDKWRDYRSEYLKEQMRLEENFAAGNNAELVTPRMIPPDGNYEETTSSDVFSDVFALHSSLTPERTGRVPYEALAFYYSATSWVDARIAHCGEPTPTDPTPPKEPLILKSNAAPGLAPYEAIRLIVGMLAAVGILSALAGVLPQLRV